MSRILFAANRSPTGHASALAVHQDDAGVWCWIDGENRDVPLGRGEPLYMSADDAKVAAHKRWQCSGLTRRHRLARIPSIVTHS